MKQIVQNWRTGKMTVEEVPAPAMRGPGAVVLTEYSLISAGTEKDVIELAKKSLLGKARQRPDLVRQFVDKVKRDGLRASLRAAFSRLDQPLLLGYSSAGTVLAVTDDLRQIAVGDRVACGGGGFASHAGMVFVSKNLLVRLPDNVSNDEACFACVGSVAMQGLRIGKPELGERVIVIGLGLVGQMLHQMLTAAGCRVLGSDPDPARRRLATDLGIHQAVSPDELPAACAAFTDEHGADAVYVTAATKSNDPVNQAAALSRRKGRVIGVGDFGMALDRRPFYERELELRMSMAYGPGRHDPNYEEKGIDYPRAYVPWTIHRNMACVVDLMSQGKLNVKPLITHRFDADQAEQAYAILGDDTPAEQRGMGVLLCYPQEVAVRERLDLAPTKATTGRRTDRVRIGMIGAGLYATSVLLPILEKMNDVELVGLATATGPSGQHKGNKFGFGYCTTEVDQVMADEAIDLVIVATRHDKHPVLTARALRAGKHVFVEKPLAITEDGLAEVLEAQRETGRIAMVGFNRRFAPMTREMLAHIGPSHGPLTISYRCNAGPLPTDHWTYDPQEGGGRIIGEACHFIDLACFLDGSLPKTIYAQCVAGDVDVPEDHAMITLRLASGSIASVAYLAGGDKSYPKERVEVIGDGRIFINEDFRSGTIVGGGAQREIKLPGDKGQAGEMRALIDAIKTGGANPIPLEQSVASCLAAIRAVESLRTGVAVELTSSASTDVG